MCLIGYGVDSAPSVTSGSGTRGRALCGNSTSDTLRTGTDFGNDGRDGTLRLARGRFYGIRRSSRAGADLIRDGSDRSRSGTGSTRYGCRGVRTGFRSGLLGESSLFHGFIGSSRHDFCLDVIDNGFYFSLDGVDLFLDVLHALFDGRTGIEVPGANRSADIGVRRRQDERVEERSGSVKRAPEVGFVDSFGKRGDVGFNRGDMRVKQRVYSSRVQLS